MIPGDVKGRETSIGEQAFEGLKSKNLNLKLRFENTSGTKVFLEDCSNLFKGSDSIIEIDLSGVDSSKARSAQRMFYGCCKLESIKFGDFKTRNVKDMSYMFQGCANLKNLDLRSFDTRNVSNMKQMFYGCKSLTSLDLSKFNTEEVTDTSYMFYNCINLTNLDVSNFDVHSVTKMSWMFANCESIKELDLNSFGRYDVEEDDEDDEIGLLRNPEKIGAQNTKKFAGILKDLDMEHKRIDLEGMFYGCSGLVKVKLSNFGFRVGNGNKMFYNCSSLKGVSCLPRFALDLTYHNDVFTNCNEKFIRGLIEPCKKQNLNLTGKRLSKLSVYKKQRLRVLEPLFFTASPSHKII